MEFLPRLAAPGRRRGIPEDAVPARSVGVPTSFAWAFGRSALEWARAARSHFGLAVFGHDLPAPGEAEILVDYAPCSEPRVEWSLDPRSSCVAPGCTDPRAVIGADHRVHGLW